jgi:hypothetical protein
MGYEPRTFYWRGKVRHSRPLPGQLARNATVSVDEATYRLLVREAFARNTTIRVLVDAACNEVGR